MGIILTICIPIIGIRVNAVRPLTAKTHLIIVAINVAENWSRLSKGNIQ